MDEKMSNLLKQADEWINAHHDEFVEELQGMTRIPSISRADLAEPGAPFGPECRRMLDYALERGRHFGFETFDHDGYAGSICLGDTDMDNSIGLLVHLDVVPEGDGWIYPPYEAVYLPEHDAIIGRGSDDNKLGAVAMLYVLRMLKEFGYPLKHGVRIMCGTSEETGMHDMIALRDKGMKFPKISLVPDAGFPVNYGQKGSANADISIVCEGNLVSFDAGTARNVVPDHAECVVAVSEADVKAAFEKIDCECMKSVSIAACEEGTRITATGKATHSASPENGVNAINVLTCALSKSGILTGSCADAVKRVYEMTSEFYGNNEKVAYRDEMSGDLTLVYGVAHLNDGKLTLNPDCRTPVTCDVEKLIADLTDAWTGWGFEVSRTGISKPYYISKEDPHVVALQKLFKDVTGRDDEPFVMGGGNYARVVPNAFSFGPGMDTKTKISDFLPAGHGACHGRDEVALMEKLFNCARIYVLAIVLFDSMTD